MQENNTYWLQHTINNYDIDFNMQLKYSALQNLLQQASAYHVEKLGLGFVHLADMGKGWVLTRMKIKVIRMPVYGEKVTIETWPVKPGFAEFERDYLLKDEKGEILVAATSRWCIMDHKTQKPVRASELTIRDVDYRSDRCLGDPLVRLRGNDLAWTFAYSDIVRASDLDLNYHMNNVRYLEWITDCFDLKTITETKLDVLQIDYLHQVRFGEELSLFTSYSPSTTYVKGEAGDNTAFLCSIGKKITTSRA